VPALERPSERVAEGSCSAGDRTSERAQSMLKIVIDVCVLFSAAAEDEDAHAESLALLQAVHAATKRGELEIHEPAQFLLEFFAISTRQKSRRDFTIWTFMPESDPLKLAGVHALTEDDAAAFVRLHGDRLPGEAPFTKGGDLAYLWAAWKVGATLVTRDRGMLKYDGIFCEVIAPTILMPRIDVGRHPSVVA
jgi:hypothetical protein